MTTLTITGKNHILGINDMVDVTISFEFQYQYGYGYGYGEYGSYFDVFGITGDFLGYGVNNFETINSGTYGYGYGYESTNTMIVQGYQQLIPDREDLIDLVFRRVMYASIKVEPSDELITPESTYKLLLNVTEPGNIIYGYNPTTGMFSDDDSQKEDLQPSRVYYTDANGEARIKLDSPYEYKTVFRENDSFIGYISPYVDRYFNLKVNVENKFIAPKTFKAIGAIRSDFVSGIYNVHITGSITET